MRKVKYRIRQISDIGISFLTDFVFEGLFHQWAPACFEHKDGTGNYTIALVETPDGKVEEILPSDIYFMPPEKIVRKASDSYIRPTSNTNTNRTLKEQ